MGSFSLCPPPPSSPLLLFLSVFSPPPPPLFPTVYWQSLGQVGRVIKVQGNSDVRVAVNGKRWIMNPRCMVPAPNQTLVEDTLGTCTCMLDDEKYTAVQTRIYFCGGVRCFSPLNPVISCNPLPSIMLFLLVLPPPPPPIPTYPVLFSLNVAMLQYTLCCTGMLCVILNNSCGRDKIPQLEINLASFYDHFLQMRLILIVVHGYIFGPC